MSHIFSDCPHARLSDMYQATLCGSAQSPLIIVIANCTVDISLESKQTILSMIVDVIADSTESLYRSLKLSQSEGNLCFRRFIFEQFGTLMPLQARTVLGQVAQCHYCLEQALFEQFTVIKNQNRPFRCSSKPFQVQIGAVQQFLVIPEAKSDPILIVVLHSGIEQSSCRSFTPWWTFYAAVA